MASRFSIETVFKVIDNFTAPLAKMNRSGKTFSQGLKTDFASAQRTIKGWGDNIKQYAWLGVAALGAAVGMAAKQGIELASNLMEVQNVVDTTFGKNAQKINEWSKSAITNFGLSELEAKKFNGTMGAMLKSSGLTGDGIAKISTDLSGLAGDFASFYNLPTEEAFTKIRSGISGETEPLKQLGINMSVANLQAFALTQGIRKKFEKMSQAEQVMLRYNYLMKVSKDAQGDFAKTLQTSLANQERVVKTKFAQKLSEMFQKLIPYLIQVADKFSAWLDTIDTGKIADFIVKVFKGIQTVIKILFVLFDVLKFLSPILIPIITAFIAYKTALLIAAAAQAVFNFVVSLNPIGIIIIAIGILIGLIILMVKNWDKITAALKKFWDDVVKFFKDLIGWIWKTEEGFTQFGAIITIITGPFGFLISALMEVGRQWDDITAKFKSGDILGGILAIGGALLSGLLAPIQGFLELISKIPGLDKIAKTGAQKIEELRMTLRGEKKESILPPVSPTERALTSIAREEKTTTNKAEVTIVDKTGKAAVTKKPAPGPYTMNLQTSGGFTK